MLRLLCHLDRGLNVDIVITKLAKEIAPRDYSASRMELGENAGKITWAHACEDALEMFGDAFNREAFDSFFAGFGAWDDAELAAHTDRESAALMLQFIAGDLRECEVMDCGDTFSAEWWSEYETLCSSGTLPARLGRHVNGVDLLYYIGE